MKKYRALVPVVMVVLMVMSWYLLIKDSAEVDATYNKYLTEARGYAENGITKYAIENYVLALEIKSSPEIYAEVADYYKAQERAAEHLSWCEDFFEEYPTNALAYDCLLDAYLLDKDYESCYDILYTAQKRNVSSDRIKAVSSDLEYVYKLDFNTYEDVAVYSNNFCPVMSKGNWGYVDRYGNQRIACKYPQVGAYTKTNFTSVVNQSGDAYFIDKTGAKVLVSKERYESFGLLVNGIIAAKKINGKYTYVDQSFNVLFGEYDYASTINNGIAAVKTDGSWRLINESGATINNEKYLDIKLDEKQIACRNDRMFVSSVEGKYIMINSSGKQIGSLVFEDAMVFAGDAPTAVKIDGKWCFVGADGKLISNKTYDGARPFANGLAAVCVAEKWGFIDSDEAVVIEPAFFGAKDFNEKGSCFVQTGDKWQLLKLYRLNREE